MRVSGRFLETAVVQPQMGVGESCKLKEMGIGKSCKLKITNKFEQVVHNVHIQSFKPNQFPPFPGKARNLIKNIRKAKYCMLRQQISTF